MNSIKLKNRMETIIINYKNSKTSYLHRLSINFSDKIYLKGSEKYVALSSLSLC